MGTKYCVRSIAVCFLFFIFPFVSFSEVKSTRKVALVIGNDEYFGNTFNKLETCVNDANAIYSCLKSLGYQKIILLKNADKQEILKEFNSFTAELNNEADEGIFFFSGHGVNLGGIQYIVPAKTDISSSETIRNDCVDITPIQKGLYRKCKYSFIFLDTFRETFSTSASKKAFMSSEIITTEERHSQMTCYVSGFNTYSRSRNGNNGLSPFTNAIIQHLFDKAPFTKVWSEIRNEAKMADYEPVMDSDYWDFNSTFTFNPNGKYKPSPTTKSITINVNPASQINISGKKYDSGQTIELKLRSIHTYTIEHEGYETYSGTLDITPDFPSEININLVKKAKSSLKITCKKPKKAEVYLDNKYMGKTPLALITTSGEHEIHIVANHHYVEIDKINLKPGENKVLSTSLTRELSSFFSFYKWHSSVQINYHFSLKYPIGLSAMYKNICESRFSAGLIYASSIGLYKGSNQLSISQSITINIGPDITTETIVDGDGNIISVTKKTEEVNPEVYSKELDPNNEAKKYDSNALILANVGFDACNGIIIEAGIGAAYHQNRYYMDNSYITHKTTTINNLTGELVGEPSYTYIKSSTSKWYKDASQWSPAIRLGARFLIPLSNRDFDEYSLTIGGGYTYLPMNHRYSSWDVSLGLTIPLNF